MLYTKKPRSEQSHIPGTNTQQAQEGLKRTWSAEHNQERKGAPPSRVHPDRQQSWGRSQSPEEMDEDWWKEQKKSGKQNGAQRKYFPGGEDPKLTNTRKRSERLLCGAFGGIMPRRPVKGHSGWEKTINCTRTYADKREISAVSVHCYMSNAFNRAWNREGT